jgi:hypothetical protein
MPGGSKGDAPVEKRKPDDQYSDDPKRKKAREAYQSAKGDDLKRKRLIQADRKARHTAIAKLKASSNYINAANSAQQGAMEQAALEALAEARYEKGQSGNAQW